MNYLSVGDLALTFRTRRQNVQIKSDLARLSEEMASGRKKDLSSVAGSDYAPIVGLERSLKALSAYQTSTAEAALFTDAMQAAAETVQKHSDKLGTALLIAGNSEHPNMIQTTTADAKNKLGAVISTFNMQVADRYAFSGAATDRPALADAGTILTALKGAIASQTTAAGVEAAVDAWFDTPGGGYETIAYTGSTNSLAPFKLSDSDSTTVTTTALDPGVRSVIKGFALAALVGDGALAGNTTERAALAKRAGEQLLTGESDMVIVRAEIGSAQAHIENASARNAAEKTALEISRNELVAVDPYETATRLEAVRNQLDTLYALTVRMSRLSLAEYMK